MSASKVRMRVDLVAEQVDPIGQRASPSGTGRSGRRARELAGRDDLRHVRVAGERELRAQRIDVEPLALRQEERVARRDTTGGASR